MEHLRLCCVVMSEPALDFAACIDTPDTRTPCRAVVFTTGQRTYYPRAYAGTATRSEMHAWGSRTDPEGADRPDGRLTERRQEPPEVEK